jgi:putative two-component system response regulator
LKSNVLKRNHIVVATGLGTYGRPIQTVLREDGYEQVSFVPGGAEVIAMCTHMWVDVLLLDLAMPDMDGLEVIEQLAPAMRRGRLQIIVVTDRTDKAVRHRALSLGARDFITEPLDGEEVKLRVRNALTTRHARGRADRHERGSRGERRQPFG